MCGFPNPASPPGAVDRLVNCSMCGISQDRSSLASALSSKSSPGGIPHSRPLSAAGSHSPSSLTISSPSAPVLPSGSDSQIPCPTCTFLNSPLLNSCEICTTPLPKLSTSAVVKSDPPAATSTPATTPANVDSLIRLSFRRGGEKEFYTILKRVLGSRAWSGGLVSFSFPRVDLGALLEPDHLFRSSSTGSRRSHTLRPDRNVNNYSFFRN